MHLAKKVNYSLLYTFSVLKIADIILTIKGLSMGAREINPLGFNALSPIYALLVIVALLVVIIKINYPLNLYVMLCSLFVINIITICAVVNNSYVILLI